MPISKVKSDVDIENPRTWLRHKKIMCNSCHAGCCTLIVEVTATDLVRLELTDEWEIENTLKSLIKRLKKDRIIKRYNFKTEKFVMEQSSNGDCIFLDQERNCRVYEKRPTVCRNHPVIAGPRPGYCPYRPAV
ncbi:MAG: YkgJ family cysteine cluster protein [Desulfobacterales bacterium]|nr:YkgJ family cysteine cluster protein [Desulfobacterales bacterium]